MTKDVIESKLNKAFEPQYLEVVNESFMHNVPKDSNSHFKVIIVSDCFEGKRLIARHRLIHQILADELHNGVHALSMHTYTLEEWRHLLSVPESPMCRGGSKANY